VNILESTKETVAVPGNSYVSRFTKGCGARNMPDRTIQRQFVRSFQNRDLQLNSGDFKNS
jgi:hypothetical protein